MIMCYNRQSKACILRLVFKIAYMKNNKQQTPFQNTKLSNNKHRPENKDNIDSREGEEQLTKAMIELTIEKKEKAQRKLPDDRQLKL